MQGPIYTTLYIIGEQHEKLNPANEHTCYSINDEIIYLNPAYKDCTTSSIETNLLSPEFYSVNRKELIVWEHSGYRLAIYNLKGELLYTRLLTSREENINLETLPDKILLCKLHKNGKDELSFKIFKE